MIKSGGFARPNTWDSGRFRRYLFIMKPKNIFLLISFLCALSIAKAQDPETLRFARIISDNMVLQQQTSNAVWGWAEAAERVTVTASWGATAATKADKNGRWKLFLATPRHGTNQALVIAGAMVSLALAAVELWMSGKT